MTISKFIKSIGHYYPLLGQTREVILNGLYLKKYEQGKSGQNFILKENNIQYLFDQTDILHIVLFIPEEENIQMEYVKGLLTEQKIDHIPNEKWTMDGQIAIESANKILFIFDYPSLKLSKASIQL